ncbi:MAG: O-methyltransferase [Chitinophagaceae bacterium]
MDIINPLAELYAERFSTEEDPALSVIAENTRANHAHAHMLSGHLQGKFLQMISQIMQPKNVLEIGTFTGYSAICLAKGLQQGGKVHTIELREAEIITARRNFNIAGVEDKIILHAGNALDIIPTIDLEWDLVFIDADKPAYIDYYKAILPKLRNGGVILADNVLFHGLVLQDELTNKSALAIREFNQFLRGDDSVDKVLLTIRDGLFFIRKK